ncbi:MAG: FtsW/RodA/SpoVE family cell cycle protein, partial [Moraxella sp.]|nr:FtsW/RodA/SpoVE family cell cycle protein [Moraxella sp.]
MNEFWASNLRRSGSVFESIACSPAMPSARTWLYLAIGTLMIFSLMMVASASMPFAMEKNFHELKYFWSQLGYMMIAIAAGMVVYRFPIKFWYSHKLIWLVFATILILLVATLFTEKINGSKRWLN